jgi:hypothetical protein
MRIKIEIKITFWLKGEIEKKNQFHKRNQKNNQKKIDQIEGKKTTHHNLELNDAI